MSGGLIHRAITAELTLYDLQRDLGTEEITDSLLAVRLHDLPGEPTIGQLLAIGKVMWEANGDMSRFADPEYLPADHVKAINSMLAYIITINSTKEMDR